ncbi:MULTISPECIES: hypothetical protein [Kitasatospora]|uniref:hypothetical protein n=1 Tax=Kitasatospora TaxID=2063 RepID=UPI000C2777B3|nr:MULTISPECIES: hypothetical protein [Kitasatospora]PJN22764.1 hypothetical protein CG736_25770 [Kitasatospora sp. CB02891]GGQ81151.1 hypothetical protein GCM10010195_41090 [Kitasatospora griseola]
MSDGFSVNPDELEAVVKRLRALQQNISTCGTNTKYKTDISRDAFGGNFVEAQALYEAHGKMQAFLTQTIADLDALINEYGDKTQTAHARYTGGELDKQATMNQLTPRTV